jgi:hypothetical protein
MSVSVVAPPRNQIDTDTPVAKAAGVSRFRDFPMACASIPSEDRAQFAVQGGVDFAAVRTRLACRKAPKSMPNAPFSNSLCECRLPVAIGASESVTSGEHWSAIETVTMTARGQIRSGGDSMTAQAGFIGVR